LTLVRRFAMPLALALVLAAPAARAGNIVVNFNDLRYPGGSFDPNQGFPSGPAPGTGSYDDGWDLSGGFTSNGVFFSNAYDATSASWSGWAYSNVEDPTTTGPTPYLNDYIHQFAAVAGAAPGGSGNYAISFGPGAVINLPAGTSPVSFEVTNSTYAYLSMTHGDGFGKPFTSGDFFELKIFGFAGLNGSGSEVGEVDFDLARYTSPASVPVDVWTLVSLTTLAGAQSLAFDYASSDVGPFGINTPEYFAMDDLTLSAAVPEPSTWAMLLIAFGGLGFVRWRASTGLPSSSRADANEVGSRTAQPLGQPHHPRKSNQRPAREIGQHAGREAANFARDLFPRHRLLPALGVKGGMDGRRVEAQNLAGSRLRQLFAGRGRLIAP
jgi:Domain of unknown function (DUF4465)/PEP-CTERM motif